MTKQQFLHNLKEILIIFVASIASAVAIELLLLPCNVVVGGALGISSILDILLTGKGLDRWYFSAGIWLIAINIPVIVYTFFTFRKRFAVKTMIYVLMLGGELIIFRVCNLADVFKNVMVAKDQEIDKVLYVLLGGALHGVSLPLLLSVNASSGGSDIVGLAVQRRSKKNGSDAMRAILLTNICILLVSSIVYFFVNKGDAAGEEAIEMFVYSVAAMFVGEIVQETI
ncbi:MAG: YitT family protein [Clostridia bacterium]|nr:YitT family protein [Clostridia bacterium]